MTATIEIGGAAFTRMRRDLRGEVEQVGFFLADFERPRCCFILGDWIPVHSSGFEIQSGFHVALTDEAKAEILGAATAAGRGLVEVHSHLGADRAGFSRTDIDGLREWVPQVRWRLGGRPYAAMVWDETSFDALAWTLPGSPVEQVEEILVLEGEPIAASGRTLAGRKKGSGDVAF
jgi:hypothetical protein